MEYDFIVKSESKALLNVFSEECRNIGFDAFIIRNIVRAECPIFDLGHQFSEALAYAKKIMEESKEKKVTYEDIANELFKGKGYFYTNTQGDIHDCKSIDGECSDPNNATTSHQIEKLLALNKLMNVAVYLNPKGERGDYSIGRYDTGELVALMGMINLGQPTFTSQKNVGRAIEMLGEDVVKLALS